MMSNMQTKNKHNEKVKLAKRLRTRLEETLKVPLFLSKAWTKRSEAIRERLKTSK